MEEHESENWFHNLKEMLNPSDWIGFLSALIGALVGFCSFIISPVFQAIAVVSAQVLLLIGWVYIIRQRYKYHSAIQRRNNDVKILQDQIDKTNTECERNTVKLEENREHMIKQLFAISNSIKSNNIHSSDILVKIPSEGDEQYELLSFMQNLYEKDPENEGLKAELLKRAQESSKKYALELFEIYKRYCRESTDEAVKLQNAYLDLKRIPLKVAIAVKLLNKPYHLGSDNVEKFKVYTAFRDHETYDKHEREIGEQLYSISGNTAFITCIKKDCFIICNINPSNDNYSNEHRRYDEFYNCTMTVPIKLKRADGIQKFFGFLCCDCLNTDDKVTDVFDRSAAQYLYAFAQNFAIFLETLDSNWIDRYQGLEGIAEGFLEMLFNTVHKALN